MEREGGVEGRRELLDTVAGDYAEHGVESGFFLPRRFHLRKGVTNRMVDIYYCYQS